MGRLDYFSGNGQSAGDFMDAQKRYAELKKEELEGIPEGEIVSAVTGWIEGKFAEDWSDMCEKINSLPTPCLNVYCADYTAKEALSGGFAQVFFNTSPDFVSAAADGFRAVGCEKTASAVDKALEIHKGLDKKGGRSLEDFLSLAENSDYAEADRDFLAAYDEKRFASLVYKYVIHYKKYFGEE